MNDITVILNVYNRPYTLEAQLDAIKNQTVKVDDENIWIWYNKGDAKQAAPKNPKHRIYVCNKNTKFHGRYCVALLAQTKFVAMFDDDVIPGNRWFENCIKTINSEDENYKPGLLGGSGVLLSKNEKYQPNNKVGWNGYKYNSITPVDLVGHATFWKSEWTKYMWYEKPVSWDNGEDIMFSYLLQKYGGINTYVPPHPINDRTMWSNIDENDIGSDENATWLHNPTHFSIRDNVVSTCIKNGWKIINNK